MAGPYDDVAGEDWDQAAAAVSGRPLRKALAETADDDGSSLLPLLPLLGMFMGVKARHADLGKLAKAKEMHNAGADRRAIRNATGWHLDPVDKSWKWEISDQPLKVTGKPLAKGLGMYWAPPMNKVIEHPEFYENYPEIGETTRTKIVKKGLDDPPSGATGYDPRRRSQRQMILEGGSRADLRSVASHEMQHTVQSAEGWGTGGNPEDPSLFEPAKKVGFAAFSKLQKMKDEIDGIAEELYGKGSTMDTLSHSARQDVFENWRNRVPKARQLEFKRMMTLANPHGAMFDAYQKVSGENEARNTQIRRDMSPKEQKEVMPWETEDYPPEEQILNLGENPNPLIPYEPGSPFVQKLRVR